MTKTEIIQHIASDRWLVTNELAASFSPSGISLANIQARRAQFDKLYATQLFDIDAKKMLPYNGIKRKPMRGNGDMDMYGDDEDEQEDENGQPVITNGIAIVYIKGTLQKDGGWCNKGTSEINSQLIELGDNPNVKGVLLYVDSGGGQVSGTETLANTVLNFKRKYKKRIEAFVDGVAGSAAYWIISGCDKITLSGETSSVGSIGTMATIVNTKEAEKLFGVQVTNIYATLSTNKNKEYEDALNGNFDPMRTNILDKLNTVFLRSVIRGRYLGKYVVEEITPDNVPEQFTGKMYFGEDARAIGLADSINTLENTLLAFDNRTQGTSNSDMNIGAKLDEDKRMVIEPSQECDPTKKEPNANTAKLTPLKSLFKNKD